MGNLFRLSTLKMSLQLFLVMTVLSFAIGAEVVMRFSAVDLNDRPPVIGGKNLTKVSGVGSTHLVESEGYASACSPPTPCSVRGKCCSMILKRGRAVCPRRC